MNLNDIYIIRDPVMESAEHFVAPEENRVLIFRLQANYIPNALVVHS